MSCDAILPADLEAAASRLTTHIFKDRGFRNLYILKFVIQKHLENILVLGACTLCRITLSTKMNVSELC
jgi:hypothetical protein